MMDSQKTIKVRIQGDGHPRSWKITDAETGARLRVTKFHLDADPDKCAASVSLCFAEVDAVIDASIDPLSYAIAVISNYEADIRSAIDLGKLPPGYCQGQIYKDAIPTLMRMSRKDV